MQLAGPDITKIRQGESFRYTKEISKPFGQLDAVLAWCRDQLINDWRWKLVQGSSDRLPGYYVFYFDSERDYFAFLLQWS
jgi:hypothetical protein